MRHQWSSGRIVPCHGTDPGSIPGWCINFSKPFFFNIKGVRGIPIRVVLCFLDLLTEQKMNATSTSTDVAEGKSDFALLLR